MTHHISHADFIARRARVVAVAVPADARTRALFRRALQAAALASLVALGVTALTPTVARALTMQECSAKYKAAQAAGTLSGAKWNDFRKAQCGDGAAAATTAPATQGAAKPAQQGGAPAASQAAPAARTSPQPAPAQPAAVGAAVFPGALSPKYSAEKPAKQRMHTCLDQYNANKGTSANGGLKWIQKGGGYYSECNKRLKS